MTKEKSKREKILSKEVAEHLKVSLVVIPALLYLLAMHNRLANLTNFMEQEGRNYFVDALPNLETMLQNLDFTYIPGGKYTLSELQDLQQLTLIAVLVIFLSTLVYAYKNMLRIRQSSLLDEQPESDLDYRVALHNLTTFSADTPSNQGSQSQQPEEDLSSQASRKD
jgi:hypothetical protein